MASIALVIPCFNEAARLDGEAFLAEAERHENLSFVFVDDGSTDATSSVLRELVGRLGHQGTLLELPTNVGKAEAVRLGMLEAAERRPRSFGYWDADLATPLEAVTEFDRVLQENPKVMAVLGSRVRLMGRLIERRLVRHYAGRVFATLAALTLGFAVYDTQCGAKLFRYCDTVAEQFREPFTAGWAFDIELLARLRATYGRDLATSGVAVEYPLHRWQDVRGSKVRPTDVPKMLLALVRIARRYRDD